jgi:lipoprotein-anchoring transpeptidase ErfK/SrfK
MPGITARPTLAALLFAFCGSLSVAQEESGASDLEVVISVADQRLVVLREGMWVEKFKVSTSKFGVGDSYGSYKTPVGRHRICDKIGEGLPLGSVIKHRNATGEILPANAPGRDPIVTRILWLEGLEQKNANARSRGIYIHGTVEEEKVGSPVSYGCIRMRFQGCDRSLRKPAAWDDGQHPAGEATPLQTVVRTADRHSRFEV